MAYFLRVTYRRSRFDTIYVVFHLTGSAEKDLPNLSLFENAFLRHGTSIFNFQLD